MGGTGYLCAANTACPPDLGTYQPFTAQCDVKSDSSLVSEKFIWQQNEVEMLSAASGDSYETQNGHSTYYLRAGSHTSVCRMTALGSDGQEFSAKQQLTVSDTDAGKDAETRMVFSGK